jgi:SSS family solute:Na+ symporter
LPSFQSSINFLEYLNFLDILVFVLAVSLTYVAVIYGNRLKKNEVVTNDIVEMLLMGRKLTLPLFVGTLVATWYGGIFGVTAQSFERGIYNFVSQGLVWYISYFIFIFFILPKISNQEAITLPDMIGKKFGPKSEKVSGILNFFTLLPISEILGAGILLQTLFGGDLFEMCFISTILVVFYSIFGGFRSIVFSDFIQFLLMFIAVLLILFFSVFNFGTWDFLTTNLPTEYFSLDGKDYSEIFMWLIISLSTIVDPSFYQRCFAAKSPQVAKKGLMISVLIWFIFDIATTFGALYARAIIPDAEANSAYLTYALQLLPSPLKGLFIAGILASVLSALDSYLFLSGTTFTYDLAPKKFQNNLYFHRAGIIFVSFLSLFLSQFFSGSILEVWKFFGTFSASSLLIPLIFGMFFPKRISDFSFSLNVITTSCINCLWFYLEHTDQLPFNIPGLYISLMASITFLSVSLFFKQKAS